MTPKVRAHRILKAMDRYIDFEPGKVPDYVTPKTCHIGVYENEPGSAENAILVTLEGIELMGENGCKILFAEMERVEVPAGDKLSVDYLNVHIAHSDTPVIVPVTGQKGRTRDAFEFMRFLKCCIADQQSA